MSLARIKEFIDLAQGVATIAAILVGGVWTYKIFVEQRQKYPRLKIEHQVTDRALPGAQRLLFVDVTVSNGGSVLVPLEAADVRVYQVLPLTPELLGRLSSGQPLMEEGRTEAEWRMLGRHQRQWKPGERFIEPGESDQFHHEFVLRDDVRTVLIYTYFKNPVIERGEVGWSLTTVYDTAAR